LRGPTEARPYAAMKYRTRKNYADGEFLGPRLGDKVFLSILILTLYWRGGSGPAVCTYYMLVLCV